MIESIFEEKLYDKIIRISVNDLKSPVRIINGIEDHIHILFLLNPSYSISHAFRQLKGSSSHWVNESKFTDNPFAWQKGYAAYSVSESRIIALENYIRNQKEHHKTVAFEQENEDLLQFHKII